MATLNGHEVSIEGGSIKVDFDYPFATITYRDTDGNQHTLETTVRAVYENFGAELRKRQEAEKHQALADSIKGNE